MPKNRSTSFLSPLAQQQTLKCEVWEISLDKEICGQELESDEPPKPSQEFFCFKILGSPGSDGMSDTIVSLGIIGAGAIWIVAGTGPAKCGLCTAFGVLAVAVGLISLLIKLRHRT